MLRDQRVLWWSRLPAEVSLEDLSLHYSVDHELDLLFCVNSGPTCGSGFASWQRTFLCFECPSLSSAPCGLTSGAMDCTTTQGYKKTNSTEILKSSSDTHTYSFLSSPKRNFQPLRSSILSNEMNLDFWWSRLSVGHRRRPLEHDTAPLSLVLHSHS